MRKSGLGVLLALTLAALPAHAVSKTYFQPGTALAVGGISLAWGSTGGVLLGGGDYGLVQFPLADTLPLDLGVSGRVALSPTGISLAGLCKVSLGWKAFDLRADWLDRIESTLSLGLEVQPSPDLAASFTTAYHLDQRWALFTEWGTFGGVLGGSYRF